MRSCPRSLRFAIHGGTVVMMYAALAVWIFHPVFSDPARTLFGDWFVAVDVKLNAWIMAWGWHALTTNPGSLFDANAFHPFTLSLAGSEHMLGHQLIFGPVYALSGNPVFAYGMNTLFNVALSGAAMYALLRYWKTPATAALFGGFIYAFCPVRDLVHAQLTAGQYLPLALLFLDRTLTEARKGPAIGLLVCLLLQMLCSYYLAYITLTALAGYGLGVLWETRGRVRGMGVALTAVAILVAGATLSALSLPYLQLKTLGVIADFNAAKDFIAWCSAGLWRNYLLPPIALREWGFRLHTGPSLYLGFLPLACALAGVMLRRPRSTNGPGRWAPAAALGLTLACYVMALGPEIVLGGWRVPMPYLLATWFVPGFTSMRVPSRFALFLLAGVAALAGLGFARLVQLIRPVKWQRVAGPVALVALTLGTSAEYDLWQRKYTVYPVRTGSELPAVYKALAHAPPGPVLEIPAAAVRTADESEYLLYSAFHWQRMLNGYSGYEPPSYAAIMALAELLPDERATNLLVRLTGLRYVVVHLANLPPEDMAGWASPPGLQLVNSFGADLLFTVVNSPSADLLPRLLDFTVRDETVLGTPLIQLTKTERRAEVGLANPLPAREVSQFWGTWLRIELTLTNRSAVTWPALVSIEDHAVMVAYRWESQKGEILFQATSAARLPYDIEPGESVRAVVNVNCNGVPAEHGLVLGLAQDGVWFPDTLGPLPRDLVLGR